MDLSAGTTLRRPALMAAAATLTDAGSHCAEGTRASTGLPNAAAAVKGRASGKQGTRRRIVTYQLDGGIGCNWSRRAAIPDDHQFLAHVNTLVGPCVKMVFLHLRNDLYHANVGYRKIRT